VRIGSNSVIGAGAVILDDIPSNVIVIQDRKLNIKSTEGSKYEIKVESQTQDKDNF